MGGADAGSQSQREKQQNGPIRRQERVGVGVGGGLHKSAVITVRPAKQCATTHAGGKNYILIYSLYITLSDVRIEYHSRKW